jgi:endonuclease/exonuclease/phosphatase family metal-dependent hydrolase
MGFCVPWRSITGTEPEHALRLQMVTVNVDSGTDLTALYRFLKEVEPDVIAFQEGPFTASLLAELKDNKFFLAGGHDTFVASRYKIVDRVVSSKCASRHRSPSVRCDIDTPAGVVRVNCVHLCSLRPGFDSMIKHGSGGIPELERVTAVRNEESQLAAEFAKQSDGPTVVLGDFNMTSDGTVFQRDWGDWQDAFSIRGFGLGYTFTTNSIGLRIDHVLADKRHWHIRACRVGPDLRSQHRPLIADLLLVDTETKRDESPPPK